MSKKTLREILKEKSISQQVVAEALGINITNIRRYDDISKRSWDEIKTISKATGIEISELIGSDINVSSSNEAQLVEDRLTSRVPLVNQYAYAGYLTGYQDETYIEQLPTIAFDVDHDPKGHYLAFEVRGDSMDDGSRFSYVDGDRLFCREIQPHLWCSSKLHLRDWDFVIVHKEGILVKRIIDHDVQNHTITIHSLNPFYEDQVIDLADVYQIFNVIGYQRKTRR